jgi:hypothetical protein
MISNRIISKSVDPDKNTPEYFLIEKQCCRVWLVAATQRVGRCGICKEIPE